MALSADEQDRDAKRLQVVSERHAVITVCKFDVYKSQVGLALPRDAERFLVTSGNIEDAITDVFQLVFKQRRQEEFILPRSSESWE
jgi:hypothetical protein